ncbi:hypothetical protein T03_14403 [Trichinella britovi]|uniref:Uncharacterized protein n=1 Tax=Trichinella britovi TaxID=45882 RepID=A0A0V1D2P2_TRIBR|nr:hypothetical protein T03_14403 [Trichinella britovi]
MQVTLRSLSIEICVHFLVTSVDQFRVTVTSSFCVHFKPECRIRHSVANNLKGRSYCLYEEHASHFVKSRIASSAT